MAEAEPGIATKGAVEPRVEAEAPPVADPVDDAIDRGRLLFRYLTVEEWRDYRAIVAVFADTFFAEFTPADVQLHLGAQGLELDEAVVGERLESLRRWGNLTVSSSVGNPTSVADYYRRRNRYLITTAGQRVHQVVEGVLGSLDEVRDVSTGRLRALRDDLVKLADTDVERVDLQALADAVGAVFDNHSAFTDEIAQFFAAINQWQSRYDLDPDEFRFFAEVLVSYVGDRLDEIERTARPIGAALEQLRRDIPKIIARLIGADDLASRVDQAGLGGTVAVAHRRGTSAADWEHLIEWFRPHRGADSRIDRLSRDAIAAIRTLTANLTRLSRIGVSASSRRSDFLRLAAWFDEAPSTAACHQVAAAALGLHPARHWGAVAEDVLDPASAQTSWWDAPRAPVASSLRERGDTARRGRASPMPDRDAERELLRRRRAAELGRRDAAESELLAAGDLDSARLSLPAVERLQELLGAVRAVAADADGWRQHRDGRLVCRIRRSDSPTTINGPHGVLTLHALDVTLSDDELVRP